MFILTFEVIRGLILLKYRHLIGDIPAWTVIGSFFVGFRFDLAVTGYIIAPAALIGLAPGIGFADSKLTRRITAFYLTVMISGAYLMNIADLEFFGQFNTRLNRLAIEWIDTPGFVASMLWDMYNVTPYLLLWIGLTLISVFGLRFLSKRFLKARSQESIYRRWIVYVLSLAMIFLAIRGRVTIKAPLTWGVAYFSPHHFTNQLALNSSFTFVRDVLDYQADGTRMKLPDELSSDNAFLRVRSMLHIDDSLRIADHPLARLEGSGEAHDLNVIIVLMESFTAEFVDCCGGSENLAPEFDRIAREGMLFTRFFSSGGHTFTGIFSTVTGLPSTAGKSIMKRLEGQQQFSGIGTILKERGYTTRFYTTHDPHFDNMQGFLVGNGFDEVISQADYSTDEAVSSLGVPDEVMFNWALDDLNRLERPFLALLLTGSAHGPFTHPDRPFKHFDPELPEAERFNAFGYADWALGGFYDAVSETSWGDSAVVVITGDHGVNWHPKHELDFSMYRVPLLFVSPEYVEPGINKRFGGQKDITPTVMDVLGGEWINNTLGNSLLTEASGHALFIEGESFGFIRNGNFLMKGRNQEITVYDMDFLKQVPVAPQVEKNLTLEGISLLWCTDFLIESRQVGLPD